MKGERGRSSVHGDYTGNYWFSKLSFIASWRFLLDGSHTYEFFISVDIFIFRLCGLMDTIVHELAQVVKRAKRC